MEAKKILIVDDEWLELQMLREILEEEGFIIDLASSGQEALEKLEKENYSLVFSDARMPGIDGFEVLKQVKDNYKNTKVILMTGYINDCDISEVLALGADDYLNKPYDNTKVVIAVKILLI